RAGIAGDVQMGVAGERGLADDAHTAGSADRLAAGATDADRAVEAVPRLQDALEHRAVRRELDGVLLPVGSLARLGVIAPQAQSEALRLLALLGLCGGHAHQYLRSSGCHWVMVTGE